MYLKNPPSGFANLFFSFLFARNLPLLLHVAKTLLPKDAAIRLSSGQFVVRTIPEYFFNKRRGLLATKYFRPSKTSSIVAASTRPLHAMLDIFAPWHFEFPRQILDEPESVKLTDLVAFVINCPPISKMKERGGSETYF